jgi:hypothetical protein
MNIFYVRQFVLVIDEHISHPGWLWPASYMRQWGHVTKEYTWLIFVGDVASLTNIRWQGWCGTIQLYSSINWLIYVDSETAYFLFCVFGPAFQTLLCRISFLFVPPPHPHIPLPLPLLPALSPGGHHHAQLNSWCCRLDDAHAQPPPPRWLWSSTARRHPI